MLASVLDPLYQLMAAILAAIYSVIPNYAVSIFGLTCIVLAILTPLTLKGLRSTIKIQKLMPEQKRLQAQFKDDRQALNEAIMAMYKENKVSPVGGCLPFIVQSPFFIALFGVLQGMTRVRYWVPTGQPFLEAQARGKTDGKIPEGAVAVGLPKHLPKGSSLYNSLFGVDGPIPSGSNLPELRHAPGEVKAFGFDLARSAADMVSKGFVSFLPYLGLIVLMVGLQVFAQRQVNRRNPAAAAANPQMQTITKVMPFMFGIFGWGFQAGLTLYWTTSSALRIVQQWALYRFDPTLAESVKEKRADLAREAEKGTGKARRAADTKAGAAPEATGWRALLGGIGGSAGARAARPSGKDGARAARPSGKSRAPGPDRSGKAGSSGGTKANKPGLTPPGKPAKAAISPAGKAGKPGSGSAAKAKAKPIERPGKGATPPASTVAKEPTPGRATGSAPPATGSSNGSGISRSADTDQKASTPTNGGRGGTSAAPPTLGPSPTPASNGAGGGSNGSGAGSARPNPGRQQPKKRRKGR